MTRSNFCAVLVIAFAALMQVAGCKPENVKQGNASEAVRKATTVGTRPVADTWLARVASELGDDADHMVCCEADGTYIVDAATGKRFRINSLAATECFLVGGIDALFMDIENAKTNTHDFYVQDLRSSSAPLLSVSSAPTNVCLSVDGTYHGCEPRYGGDCVLSVSADGAVSLEPPDGLACDLGSDCEGHRKAVKKIAIAHGDVLATLARTRKSLPVPAPSVPKGLKSPVVIPPRDCEDPEVCGEIGAVTTTGIVRIAISHSCGDACYVDWVLYDSASREFINPENPLERSGSLQRKWADSSSLYISPSEQYYERSNCVYGWKGGTKTCGNNFAGFVGAGRRLH